MQKIKRGFTTPALAAILALSMPLTARAGWIQDGTGISVASGFQGGAVVVADGQAGAIITWEDMRGDFLDIYSQRVDGSGTALWTTDGQAICAAADDQFEPVAITDGGGGAIIAWDDYRAGEDDVYAQRVGSSGVAQWTADGTAICTATGSQVALAMVADGGGGAIVVWQDIRSGTDWDIYAQKINAAGAVQWTADGVPISTADGNQLSPNLATDGSGGAIIAWHQPGVADNDIYTQRIDAAGTVQWTTDGVAICTATGEQAFPSIASDDAGGAIITWHDSRDDDNDVYAQRINSLGVVQWSANGLAVSAATMAQASPEIVPDGVGGAIITWYDFRNSEWDIFAQRVNSLGAGQWTAGGVSVCTSSGDQLFPRIADDGAGGAIVSWRDSRNGNADIYVQRLGPSGAVSWAENGVALCTASGAQIAPCAAADGSGGAIVAWQDSRSGASDIYAARVSDDGIPVPVDLTGFNATPIDEGIFLEWAVSRVSGVNSFKVHRSANGRDGYYVLLSDESLRSSGNETVYYSYLDTDVIPGTLYHYKLEAIETGEGNVVFGPFPVVAPNRSVRYFLSQNTPNPFTGATGTKINYSVAEAGRAVITIFDSAGRLVKTILDQAAVGANSVEWNGRYNDGRLAARGVYFYEIRTAGFRDQKKMIMAD